MIITQDGYDPGDNPPGVPLIGYDNKISSVFASTEAAGFPASNLLNSATYLYWKADSNLQQFIGLSVSGECDYLAIAKHNFADVGVRVSLAQSPNLFGAFGSMWPLMHFEGTNGGTDYFDSSGYDIAFESITSGTLSNSQFKFGAMSVSFNGTGYIRASGSIVAFDTEDFTIDFWVRITATGSIYTLFDSGAASTGMSIRKTATDVLVFKTGNVDRITGATALTTGTWHHIALSRSSGSTRMFLNGVQQGSTYADTNAYDAPTNGYVHFGANISAGEFFNGFIDELRILHFFGEFTANFPPPTAAYADGFETMIGNYSALFHFDGTDASTTISDSGGADHVFTAQGNAQLDTAQFKFGTASLLLDGTGDYIKGDGSADFTFGTMDFTIDFWIRLNANGCVIYDSRPVGVSTGPYVTIYTNVSNKLIFFTEGADKITSTTSVTTGAWHHIAVSRLSGFTFLFLDGIQEGSTYADANNYLNDSDRPVIGIDGALLTAAVNGWIDEVRVIKGTALYFSKFVPPTRAAGSQAAYGKGIVVDDNLPLIFRFSPTSNLLTLSISAALDEPAQAAVIYAGEILVMERGVKADVQHSDIAHARGSDVLAGMSESGNFLGRVLLSEWRESQADFAWFTPTWYRSNFEPFVQFAMTQPFFWAWNPDEYPEDTAFAWIVQDIRPETDPATRRMAATISMRAIA